MKIISTIAFISASIAFSSTVNAADCQKVTVENNRYIICTADLKTDRIELHLRDENQTILGSFSALQKHIKKKSRQLVFAFNAGMYHPDRRPVGLFVSHGKKVSSVKIGYGTGNFSLKPNGVFYIEKGRAAVEETKAFIANKRTPALATQSGPMLVINKKIHPKFRENSDSRKIRNGVGVMKDGQTVFFALALNRVNFHTFARLFRNHLKTPNALYLDGTISQIYSPQTGRTDTGTHMGPIIGVTKAK